MKKLLIFLLTLLLSGAQLYSSPYSLGYGDSKKNTSSKNTLGCASAVLGMGVVNKCMPTGGKVTIKPRKDNGRVSWSSNLKGDVGEAVVDRMLNRSFDGRQKWRIITPRNKPQGFDHLAVRWKKGKVADILVAETKVNTSKLSTTKDGVRQMSKTWIRERMQELSSQYTRAEKANIAGFNSKASRKAMICETNVESSIPGEYEYFWSPDKGKTWYYSGDESSLKEGQRQLREQSQYFQGVADGKIGYEGVLYEVDLKSETKTITRYFLDEEGNVLLDEDVLDVPQKKPKTTPLDFTDPDGKDVKIVRELYKNRLMENGLSEYEAERLANNAKIDKIADGELFEKSIRKDVRKIRAIKSGVTVVSAVIFDALLQVVMNHGFQNFNWKQSLVVAGGSSIAVVGLGHVVNATERVAAVKLEEAVKNKAIAEMLKYTKLTNICKFVAKYSAEIVMVGVMLFELGEIIHNYRKGNLTHANMKSSLLFCAIPTITGVLGSVIVYESAAIAEMLSAIGISMNVPVAGYIVAGLGTMIVGGMMLHNRRMVKKYFKNQGKFVEDLLIEQSLSNQTMRRRYYSYT